MYKNKIVFGVIFIGLFFFMIRYSKMMGISVVETVSSCVMYPLLRTQHVIIEPVTRWINRRVEMQDLQKMVEQLQKERDHYCKEVIALKGMQHYMHSTAELRKFNARYALSHGHIAQILARHFSAQNQFFLVDVGSAQGIKKDMVALYGNAIVGRVTEVYPWYCKICLITDSDCKVAALSHQTHATGIHEGINDELYTVMRYVSHLGQVNVDDDLFSSGEGLIFPKGFMLGKVVDVSKGDLFYTVTARTALDFKTLCYCTLIAKGDI